MCFGMPSVSMDKTLRLVFEQVASLNYEVLYYNTEAFRPKERSRIKFRAYPDSYTGYRSDTIEGDILYFRFGSLLVDTAASMIDFLMAEAEREKPDFILHSHLALWGKLIAKHLNIPAVSVLATFVMDERIMLPQLQKRKRGEGPDVSSIREGRIYYQKIHALYDKLGLQEVPNIWDAYVNQEKFNVSLITGDLQPRRELIKPHFKFAGLPIRVEREVKQDYIYVALGTVFNANLNFYKLCLRVLKKRKLKGVISVGNKINIDELGEVPDFVRVAQYVDQIEVLKKASIFITHGGPPSVQEAICTLTPMIVTPRITEQRLVGERVEELAIGIYLSMPEPTEEELCGAIDGILGNYKYYVDNLESVIANAPAFPAPITASYLIDTYLKTELKRNPVILE